MRGSWQDGCNFVVVMVELFEKWWVVQIDIWYMKEKMRMVEVMMVVFALFEGKWLVGLQTWICGIGLVYPRCEFMLG